MHQSLLRHLNEYHSPKKRNGGLSRIRMTQKTRKYEIWRFVFVPINITDHSDWFLDFTDVQAELERLKQNRKKRRVDVKKEQKESSVGVPRMELVILDDGVIDLTRDWYVRERTISHWILGNSVSHRGLVLYRILKWYAEYVCTYKGRPDYEWISQLLRLWPDDLASVLISSFRCPWGPWPTWVVFSKK